MGINVFHEVQSICLTRMTLFFEGKLVIILQSWSFELIKSTSGGPNTLKTTHLAVEGENQTPCVVVKGSGR